MPTPTRRHPAIARWCLALACAALPTVARAAASSLFIDEPRWQFSIAVNSETSYVESAGAPIGGELALSYRLSRHVGVGLTGMRLGYQDEFSFGFFGVTFGTETSYRPTWILARTDFHLTPDRRVDLIFSPLVGMARIGDVRVRTFIDDPFGPPITSEVRFDSEDETAWGARLALDIPLGRTPGRSSLTTGLTYLNSSFALATEVGPGQREEIEFELDPLTVHVGYAFSF